jgi:hypothetical protein
LLTTISQALFWMSDRNNLLWVLSYTHTQDKLISLVAIFDNLAQYRCCASISTSVNPNIVRHLHGTNQLWELRIKMNKSIESTKTERDMQKTNGKLTATKAKFMTRNDMDLDIRQKVIGLLNLHLACTFDLMSQTKQAHWNVKGPHFIGLHELFDSLAEKLEKHIDTIAERVTTLGGVALGTVRMVAGASTLEEYPADIVGTK